MRCESKSAEQIMHDTADTHDHCICICNGLLRGELSALETYRQAIEKYAHSPAAEVLRLIRSDHAHSANLLSANVRDMNGEPDRNSGAWGLFATLVQGTANLFGPESAVESLLKGEEIGRKNYEEALLDDEVMPDCKKLIRDRLLPTVFRHLSALGELEMRSKLDS
jgi:hypothetical protein